VDSVSILFCEKFIQCEVAMDAYGYQTGQLIIGVIITAVVFAVGFVAVGLVAAKHARHARKRALSSFDSFDSVLDVLSVQLADARVVRARPSKVDSCLIFELDQHGRIVGVEILAPTSIDVGVWYQHPDRAALPEALRNVIDVWLRETNTAR
jgi:uncharacterized protein YuzE